MFESLFVFLFFFFFSSRRRHTRCSRDWSSDVCSSDLQQILIGQEHELSISVSPAFPLALAVVEIDTRENASVESERMAFVNDEVVEVRLETVGRPSLRDRPSAAIVRERDTTDAGFLTREQNVTVGSHRGLHDAVRRPLVLPQLFAVGWGNTRETSVAREQHLRDAVDRCEMW